MSESKSKPDYGIDAPGLLRFFFTFGAIALSMFLLVLLSSLLSHTLKIIACFIFGIVASYLLGMGCLMVYFSKVQKLKEREALLGLVQWSGSEIVLDIGCGRGLMLIGAAKRLTSGKAFGIDLWQQKDQASNSLEVTLTNAEIEGVADRIEVKTADMRQLPFSENYFDVVTSNWAVHNLEAEKDRQQALSEIIRVLKPGGVLVLADIVNQAEYAQYFKQRGMVKVKLHNKPRQDALLKAITFGSFAPSVVSAHKSI